MSLKPHPVFGPGQLRVQVDRERCQGHARCVAVASEPFQLDRTRRPTAPKRNCRLLIAARALRDKNILLPGVEDAQWILRQR